MPVSLSCSDSAGAVGRLPPHIRDATRLRSELKMIRWPSGGPHGVPIHRPGSNVSPREERPRPPQVPGPQAPASCIADVERDARPVGREVRRIHVGARRRGERLLVPRAIDPHQPARCTRGACRRVPCRLASRRAATAEIARPGVRRHEPRHYWHRRPTGLQPVEIEGDGAEVRPPWVHEVAAPLT